MFRTIIFSIFLLLLASCSGVQMDDILGDSHISTGGLYSTGLTDTERVSLALARKKELPNIRKGDYMTLKNNPETAIAYYMQALERIPDDIIVRRKLAHAYYLTKNWKNAYDAYAKVPINELKSEEYVELFQSLFFDDARPDRLIELSKYTIDTDTRDYYSIIDTCYSGIHNCIVTIETYTGSSVRIVDLQKTIKDSVNISPDYQYRNFLVSTLFYTQGMYRAVDILTKEVLEKRPNYIEVRKLRGLALYELGRYSESRDILLSYLEQKPKDIDTIIRLGEIYYQLGDYTTSSLYLNNAITAGYPKKTEIERRLAYNYSALQDYSGMTKVLGYLLQEPDVTEDDYAVAVSLALKTGENTRAYAWSYAGMEKFPTSKILTPLYLSSLRSNAKFHEVLSFVQ